MGYKIEIFSAILDIETNSAKMSKIQSPHQFFSHCGCLCSNTNILCVFVVAGKDDVFGENICQHETIGKSSCNVRALTYCDLHKIIRDDLLDILEMYPEFADHFVKNLEVTFDLRDVSIKTVDKV